MKAGDFDKYLSIALACAFASIVSQIPLLGALADSREPPPMPPAPAPMADNPSATSPFVSQDFPTDISGNPIVSHAAPVPGPPVAAGPLADKRQELVDRIYGMKANGVGIANYMAAFDYIETLARGNASESALQSRMDSLQKALDDQEVRSTSLKATRPGAANNGMGMPTGVMPANGIAAGTMGPGPMAGNTDPAALMRKMMENAGRSEEHTSELQSR